MKIPKIIQLPSGSWFCQLRIDGKSISITEETRRDVEAKAYAYKYGVIKQQKTPDKIKLSEAMDRYIAERENILSPSTIREYRRIRETDVSIIGDRYIGDITSHHIQKYINRMSATLSPKTVKNRYTFVVSVIKDAMPSAHFECLLPQKKKFKAYSPTEADIVKLLAYVKGEPIEIPILLAAFGSLRRSEICALTIKDVKNNGVYIDKALVKNDKGEHVIKTTKSTESERLAHLPKEIVEYIRERCNGKIYPYLPNSITDRFAKVLSDAGIPHFRFHDLRHYWVSVAHAMGMPDYYIMKNGGWTTMETPRKIYMNDMSELVEDKENAVLSRFSTQFSIAKK